MYHYFEIIYNFAEVPTPVGVVTEHHNNVRVVKVPLHNSKQSEGVMAEHYNHIRVVKVPLHKSKQ